LTIACGYKSERTREGGIEPTSLLYCLSDIMPIGKIMLGLIVLSIVTLIGVLILLLGMLG
jgi:hypothetical protein